MIPYLRTENLKNHTLSRGTYLYSPYMGVPPGFRRGVLQKLLTTCTLEVKALQISFIIGSAFFLCSSTPTFAFLRQKPSSALENPLYWDGCGQMAPSKTSPHKLAALSTIDPQTIVQGLRSFVGAYMVFSPVLQRFTELLDPLHQATAGKESCFLVCSEELLLALKTIQRALNNHKTIKIPQPCDAL